MIEAAVLGTLIPMLLLLFILRHSRPVMSVFCWGIVAFMISYYTNSALSVALGVNGDLKFVSIFIAPPIEEFFKMLPLLYFLFFAQDSFLPFIYIFGMAIGIGFSIEENLLYLFSHYTQIGSSLIYMVVRSLSTCLLHGMTTATVGFTFTYIRRKKRLFYLLIPAGYLIAVAIHALYNFLVLSNLISFGLLMAFIIYIAGVIVMRQLAEQMPEAHDTSWQR